MKQHCPRCHHENHAAFSWCTDCGWNLPTRMMTTHNYPIEQRGEIECTCGAGVSEDMNFCSNCGEEVSDLSRFDIELKEGQVWEWDAEDDVVLISRSNVVIEELFTNDDGDEMVEFVEPPGGPYGEVTSTAPRKNLKQSLARNYKLKEQ